MKRDVGRAAVYAAELVAFEGTSYESLVTFDELAVLARGIERHEWWPRGEVELRPARRDAVSSTTSQQSGARPVVRLASSQMTPATLVHELAHVLAGLHAGHDAVFLRAHIDLVDVTFGAVEAGWLLAAYSAMGLGPGRRRWVAPPAAPMVGGALAL